jgi:hypothetical protein
MDPYYSALRQSLDEALAAGKLTRASSLEENSDKLSQILDLDPLDLVEIDMELEARGIANRTVGSLIDFMKGGDDAEDPPLVKK